LYRGIAQDHVVSQLGAAAIEDNFAPSVLVAATLGTLRFCLGATMAVRRTVLDGIGGIDALGPFLADDHKLGELVTAAGHRIVLSRYVVATGVPETTLRSLWSHELRWARTNLVLAPAGYTFSFLMYALPLSVLYLACSLNARIGVPLVLTALVLRICLHAASRTALGVARPFGGLLLVPLRDAFSFGVWFASFFGRSVRWRDVHVGVATDGQLT
jgi:ceramide glucosyltransferase